VLNVKVLNDLIIAKPISFNKVFGFKDPKNFSQTESEDIKHAEVVGYSYYLSILLAVVDVSIPTGASNINILKE